MPEGTLKLLNWNIAGAKYLELPSKQDARAQGGMNREDFRAKLNIVLKDLLRRDEPDVVALQEVVSYEPGGNPNKAKDIIDIPVGYDYHPLWLIDTVHHSATGKWHQVRLKGGWKNGAYFAQGNAILVRKREGLRCFRLFDLPPVNTEPDADSEFGARIETVKLESGLYLGDRNTEPRAALVTHLVLSRLSSGFGTRQVVYQLERPLDVFVINLHLTTLLMEREGVPGIDELAAHTRLRQLDIVLDGIVSRYNTWAKEGYKWRKEGGKPLPESKSMELSSKENRRQKPIWVLAGDFNFTPESLEYESLVRRGLIDMIRNHELGTKTSGLGETPTLTVDYVFAGPRFEAIDPGVAAARTASNKVEVTNDTRISDHFPLIVSLPVVLDKP